LNTDLLCRQNLVERYRNEFQARHALRLQFGPTIINVTANRKEIIDGLAAYFGKFVSAEGVAQITITLHEAPAQQLPLAYTVKQPDPGKTKIKEEFVDLADGRIVRKRLTGMLFVFGGDQNLAIGPCLANLNQVVNFINNRHIEKLLCDGCLLGHAAGVVINGCGLALAGFSGAGKSTLALHLMSKGALFVSNDRLMVKDTGQGLIMHGVAKLPRINPGTAMHNDDLAGVVPPAERRQFEALPTDELWELEHKYDVYIDACFGPMRFHLQAPLHALVVINWQRTGQPLKVERVNPRERQDLLPAFMKSTGLFFTPDAECRSPQPTPEAYMDLLSLCHMYEISGGTDFDAATEACLAISERIIDS
jgi:HprK-related kinase B